MIGRKNKNNYLSGNIRNTCIVQLNSFYIKFDSKHFFYLYNKYYN